MSRIEDLATSRTGCICRCATGILLLLSACSSLPAPVLAAEEEERSDVSIDREDLLVIAHRGRSGVYPENTLVAFEAAIATGADFFELDVHLTRDGVPVVIHDADLKRTTGVEKKVQDVTYDELRGLDAGSWKDARFEGEPIPTLRESLEMARDRISVMVELKSGNPGVADKAVELVRELGMERQVIIASFDEGYVRRVKELDCNLRTMGLRSELDEWEELAGVDVVGSSVGNPIEAEWIQSFHRRGMQLWIWTEDDPEEMELLAGMGVDGIITDYPEYITGRE